MYICIFTYTYIYTYIYIHIYIFNAFLKYKKRTPKKSNRDLYISKER